MKDKARILTELRYLREHTDEDTEVTAVDFMKALREAGEQVSRPTLREDIAALQKAGYSIEVHELPGLPTTYQLTNREWSPQELQILVDAVASGQFITPRKSAEIIGKLQAMAGPSDRERLVPAIDVEERCKAENEQVYYIVQAIQQAIRNDAKIRFQHYEYSMDLERVPKHDGYEYVVSPYAMIWRNDRYYLIGFSEKHGDTVHFRIDRMGLPKQVTDGETGEPVRRVPPPADFVLKDRTDKIFSMFDGTKETVKLRCASRLVGQVIDRFGKQLDISERTPETFDVTQDVYVSPTFYAWVFQYAGGIRILGPEWVREECAGYLRKAMEGMTGDGQSNVE